MLYTCYARFLSVWCYLLIDEYYYINNRNLISYSDETNIIYLHHLLHVAYNLQFLNYWAVYAVSCCKPSIKLNLTIQVVHAKFSLVPRPLPDLETRLVIKVVLN